MLLGLEPALTLGVGKKLKKSLSLWKSFPRRVCDSTQVVAQGSFLHRNPLSPSPHPLKVWAVTWFYHFYFLHGTETTWLAHLPGFVCAQITL